MINYVIFVIALFIGGFAIFCLLDKLINFLVKHNLELIAMIGCILLLVILVYNVESLSKIDQMIYNFLNN